MLTAKTQYNLTNAREYFEEHLCVGDYYDEGQRVAGQWIGAGAEQLGLTGKVRADGRPMGLVLAEVHFLATRTRNQRSKVSGVTRVAHCPRRRRPTSLALRASRMRWASVKYLGFPPSCSRRIRFSSWRYSMTACWCRLIQPATAMSRNWNCVVTAWRIFQRSLWLNPPSDLG